MIDVKLILEKPEYVKEALKKKNWEFDPAPIQMLSEERLSLLKEVEALRLCPFCQKRRRRRQSRLC